MRSHALVIAPTRDDLAARFSMIPPAIIRAGRCISCRAELYVNESGARAIRDRDADVCCPRCESLYTADINRSLIES
jgi:hypothetical protein